MSRNAVARSNQHWNYANGSNMGIGKQVRMLCKQGKLNEVLMGCFRFYVLWIYEGFTKTLLLSILSWGAWVKRFARWKTGCWVGNWTEHFLKNLPIVSKDNKAFHRWIKMRKHCYVMKTDGINYSAVMPFMSENYLKIIREGCAISARCWKWYFFLFCICGFILIMDSLIIDKDKWV